VRSWLMVMQGWDFATVKDACPAGLRPEQEYAYPAAAIPMLFLLFAFGK